MTRGFLRLFWSTTLLILSVSLLSTVKASAPMNTHSDDNEDESVSVHNLSGVEQQVQPPPQLYIETEQDAQGENDAFDDDDGQEDGYDNEGNITLHQLTASERSENVYLQIIAGTITSLPANTLSVMDPANVLAILITPLGARLAATRFTELFSNLEVAGFLTADVFDNAFFLELDIFSDLDGYAGNDSIPADIILRAIYAQSAAKKLNLNGFFKKLQEFSVDVCFNLNQIFLLPHLFDVPRVNNLEFYLGRGIAFNPDGNASRNDINVWNIAIQLFMFKATNYPSYKPNVRPELIEAVSQALASYSALYPDSVCNYFGIVEENESSPIFSSSKSLSGATIEELGASVGIPDFMNTKYTDLTSEDRIRYRLIIYLTIFNPFIVGSESKTSDLIVNLVTSAHANDFTKAEIDFFVIECLNNGFFDAVARIFRLAPNSRFRKAVEREVGADAVRFQNVIERVTSAVFSLPFLTRWSGSNYLEQGIIMKNENFYKSLHLSRFPEAAASGGAIASADADAIEDGEDSGIDILDFLADAPPPVSTKRSHSESAATPSVGFNNYFLSPEQISHLTVPVNNLNYGRQSFTVPCPDKDFFMARMDNLMQNLDSSDFGETTWKLKINELCLINPEIRVTYAENEKTLDKFVRETFKIIHSLHLTPNRPFEISFTGSPSFGNGLKQETIEMFNRAILLPKYKILYYNPAILGFVPYPLLDGTVLGMLGFLNAFSIEADQPICWQLSSDYTKFLFYEGNSIQEETLEDLVKKLYKPLFNNIEALVDPHINPIEYFPTVFHSHQPLPFNSNNANTPLDLFAPFDGSRAQFSNLGSFLSAESLELLDEAITLPSAKRTRLEKRKCEDLDNMIESRSEEQELDEETAKQIDLLEKRFTKQQNLKRKIVDSIIQILTEELVEHLLVGRFNFMRMYLRAFNTFSQKFITANFYDQLQAAHSKPFTAEEIVGGLRYQGNEFSHIEIIGADGEVFTPRQTLEIMIRSLDSKMLRAFYWFCTGCFSLPIGGLDSNPITVQIIDKLLLPSSQTCFRTFKFNVQRSYLANVGALKTALMESSGYHYIENSNQRQVNAAGAGNMAAILALNGAAGGGGAGGAAVYQSESDDDII